jgi:hypothetical protein
LQFDRDSGGGLRIEIRLTTRECQRLSVGPHRKRAAMPRYYFNTRIGNEVIDDPEGEELRNPDSAWEIARAMIEELLKTEGVRAGLLNAVLEVTDDEGEIVLEFPFVEAILGMPDDSATKH